MRPFQIPQTLPLITLNTYNSRPPACYRHRNGRWPSGPRQPQHRALTRIVSDPSRTGVSPAPSASVEVSCNPGWTASLSDDWSEGTSVRSHFFRGFIPQVNQAPPTYPVSRRVLHNRHRTQFHPGFVLFRERPLFTYVVPHSFDSCPAIYRRPCFLSLRLDSL